VSGTAALLLAVYFLPTLVGAALRISGLGFVIAVNLLGGWTLLGLGGRTLAGSRLPTDRQARRTV
jgi:hypothetical protein